MVWGAWPIISNHYKLLALLCFKNTWTLNWQFGLQLEESDGTPLLNIVNMSASTCLGLAPFSPYKMQVYHYLFPLNFHLIMPMIKIRNYGIFMTTNREMVASYPIRCAFALAVTIPSTTIDACWHKFSLWMSKIVAMLLFINFIWMTARLTVE